MWILRIQCLVKLTKICVLCDTIQPRIYRGIKVLVASHTVQQDEICCGRCILLDLFQTEA